MKTIKISNIMGHSIIADRAKAADFDVEINHVSSTEAQPYIGVNFDRNGFIIGGRTLTEGYVQKMLNMAAEKNWKVEQD